MDLFSGQNAKPTLYSDESEIASGMIGADSFCPSGDPERVQYK
jgi:hypothetical protein